MEGENEREQWDGFRGKQKFDMLDVKIFCGTFIKSHTGLFVKCGI